MLSLISASWSMVSVNYTVKFIFFKADIESVLVSYTKQEKVTYLLFFTFRLNFSNILEIALSFKFAAIATLSIGFKVFFEDTFPDFFILNMHCLQREVSERSVLFLTCIFPFFRKTSQFYIPE